jgi:predicted MPP superfamily phosphohydrolase
MARPRRRREAATAAILVAVLALLALDAFVLEPRSLVLRKERLALPQWNAPRLRIALMSDLHVGSHFIDAAKVDEIISLTNEQEPDLVVLLGDYVVSGSSIGEWLRVAPDLARIRSRLGTYAILGNHDWWTDGNAVRHSLEQAGIQVLENEVAPIHDRGRTFWLWGLADLWTRPVDLTGPLGKIPPEQPTLALTHNPDLFPRLPPRVSLTLAGHTHGGQVWLPLLGRLVVPSSFGQRYAAGHITEGGRDLFVTTGIGTSILPVRFGVPPEVVLLELSGTE